MEIAFIQHKIGNTDFVSMRGISLIILKSQLKVEYDAIIFDTESRVDLIAKAYQMNITIFTKTKNIKYKTVYQCSR